MIRTTLALVSAFVFALLSTQAALAQTPTLRIQDYPGIGNFLVRVANARGLCEKHGIRCELRPIRRRRWRCRPCWPVTSKWRLRRPRCCSRRSTRAPTSR